MNGRRRLLGSFTHGSMANAMAHAIGVQASQPGRQVVSMSGDGGFAMLMAEFLTAVKYQLPIKVVIVKNNSLGQIKWEQMVFLGNPEHGVELQPIDFVKVAEACGAVGFRCETPGEVRFRAQVTDHLKGLPTPFVETDKVVATIYSAATIDEAANGAIHRMAQFLTDFAHIPLNDAGMLMSLVGELKFCQVVDPLKTIRFEFPKWVLAEYGYAEESIAAILGSNWPRHLERTLPES